MTYGYMIDWNYIVFGFCWDFSNTLPNNEFSLFLGPLHLFWLFPNDDWTD